jgi:Tfp pilus assembly protein PilN
MRAVNLMPRDVQDTRSRRGALPVLAALALLVAVTAVLGVLGMQASAQADGYEADLALTEAALARLPKPAPTPALPDMSAERSNRIAALQSALATRVPVDRLLTDLSYVVPDDVWLTGFSLAAPTETGTATVTIEGTTYSQPAIARFLARLSTLPALDGSRLTKSERVVPQAPEPANGKRVAPKPKAVITFTVTADVAQGTRS